MQTDKSSPLFHLSTVKRASGGGRAVARNLELLAKTYPCLSGDDRAAPYTLASRNWVKADLLVTGRFVLLPQNAWPWRGDCSHGSGWQRRMALRAASEVSMRRAMGVIRIGKAIPEIGNAIGPPISNVLDDGFDDCLSVIASEGLNLEVRKRFVSVGSATPYRGLRTLLQAFTRYRAMGGTWPLVVQDSASQPITLQDAHIGIETVRGPLHRSDLLNLLLSSAVAVFPSTVEASPISVLEAQELEVPAILSDIAGHREMSHQGAYFSSGDSEELANLMITAEVESPPGSYMNRLGSASEGADRRREERSRWVSEVASRLAEATIFQSD